MHAGIWMRLFDVDVRAGLVPEFVNPKYADAAKSVFQKPTRLECMMQDHPRVLLPGARVGFVQLPDWTYSPVKNSLAEAVKKAAAGVAPRCASEGELEFYEGMPARIMRCMLYCLTLLLTCTSQLRASACAGLAAVSRCPRHGTSLDSSCRVDRMSC